MQSPLLRSIEVTLSEAIDAVRGASIMLDEAGDQARALSKDLWADLHGEAASLDYIESKLEAVIKAISVADKTITRMR